MANDWYFMESGQTQGPVSASQLQQMASLGRITATTQVTKGSTGRWVDAGKVKGLSFVVGVAQPSTPLNQVAGAAVSQPSTYSTPTAQAQEQLLWSGRPSQIVNLYAFIWCGLLFLLVVPIFVALWKWITIQCVRYDVTNQRFRVIQGVFSRRTDELELYRIKDTTLIQPFWSRIFSLANIVMTTSDMSTPSASIKAIPFEDAKQLRETLRSHVERLRERKRVREVDVI